eukprot:TRINITY_DN18320_c0_g1_i1.p1 TRINITY_DN18320_c0_g1~~TRINITY_DN18320_c0_g1_i1.p1  ORF type:complete len:317 (+),score=81.31 TRINITY_DN18320_c0_g1_i1:113-952(+)
MPADSPDDDPLGDTYRGTGDPSRATSGEQDAATRIQALQRQRLAKKECEERAQKQRAAREQGAKGPASDRRSSSSGKVRRQFPDSTQHPSFRYILFPFGEGTPECTFLKEEVLPALAPALEAVLMRIVAINLEHQRAAKAQQEAARRPPPPRPPSELDDMNNSDYDREWDRYRGELRTELEFERATRWGPRPHLPQEPLQRLGLNPVRWLAEDLRRRSITYRRRQAALAQKRQKEQDGRRRSRTQGDGAKRDAPRGSQSRRPSEARPRVHSASSPERRR